MTRSTPTEHLDALVDRVRETVLIGPGVTAPALRQAIEARAAAMSGGVREADDVAPIPEDLIGFADRVATAAWRVTDEDIESLLGAGYSQDEVFEITVSAAMGAAHARLERGLAALRGEV
jgi:alkylhydroperoxidase family enzyme